MILSWFKYTLPVLFLSIICGLGFTYAHHAETTVFIKGLAIAGIGYAIIACVSYIIALINYLAG